MYSEGWFCTVIVGWQTACTVCTAGTVAVAVAVAVVVTVAVAVAVAAAVAGGQCPPLLLLRLFLLRVLPPCPSSCIMVFPPACRFGEKSDRLYKYCRVECRMVSYSDRWSANGVHRLAARRSRSWPQSQS